MKNGADTAQSSALPRPFATPADQRGWILLFLAVGISIAFADGLTRLPEVAAPEDTFTYHAVWGAWTLGAVMLPLFLLYAEAIRIRILEGILLWFLVGTVTFQKDFSYIRWPGAPIFVTDVVLAGLVWRLFVSPRRFKIQLRSRPARLTLLYLSVGLLTIAWSLLERHTLLLALRDSAIVYYSLFIFVGYAVVRDWNSVRRAFVFFLLGAIFACINALGLFLHSPGGRRYIGTGVYVLAAFIGVLVFTDRRILRPTLGYGLAAVLALGLLLANARSLYVALGVVLIVMALFGSRARRQLRRVRLRTALSAFLAVVLGGFVVAQTHVGSAFVSRSERMLASGTVGFEHDPNALWRLAAWSTALSLFAHHPLFGTGYGVTFKPFDVSVNKGGGPSSTHIIAVDVDTRPHNSYLTVLYQMGLLGFGSLAAVLFYYFKAGWSALRQFRRDPRSVWLYVALLFQLCMCVYGGFNLMFESPFSASIFWLGLGVGWRIQNLLRTNVVPTTAVWAPEPQKS